jgi:cell division septum initiation protein DivIVA
MQINRAIIEAAIVGFEQQKRQIDETIAELRAQLNGSAEAKNGHRANVADTVTVRKKRHISAAGRRAIAEAQRKRWAAQKERSAEPKPAPKAKRKISPAAKAKLVANLAKARAARIAKRAAA